MIITLHEQRARGRQRLWWGAVKLVLMLVILGGTFVFAHRLGREAGGREVNGLRQEIAVLNATVADLQAEVAAATPSGSGSAMVSRQIEDDAQAGTALLDSLLARIAELEAEVAQRSTDAAVPAAGPAQPEMPEMQEMVNLLRAKLDEGVTPARLRAAVEGLTRERSCVEPADTRRFVVQTEARRDEANGSVTFAEGIRVTAEGAVPAEAEGRARLRFDPTQPVTVHFSVTNGAASDVSGMLPLQHSVVIGDKEHLFTAEAGEPGFLRITKKTCAYP